MKGISIKFYVLPIGKNSLACYLARRDSWYNRHVYIPFRMPAFILPWLNVDQHADVATGSGNEIVADVLPPGAFFRKLMEDFAREAEQTYNVNVYKCEGWLHSPKDQKDEDKFDQLIPMMQRCEIGQNVSAFIYKQKKSLPDDTSMDELQKDKAFTFTNPELRVKFSQVNMKGVVTGNCEDEAISYTSILLSNIPQRGDKVFPPDPTNPWLEMHAQVQKGSKPKDPTKRSTLLADAKQHTNYIEITSSLETGSFQLLIDGQLFGPFYKIRISPIELGGKRVVFPAAAFFPLSV